MLKPSLWLLGLALLAAFSSKTAFTQPQEQLKPKVYSGPCIMQLPDPKAPRYQVTGRVLDDVTGAPVAGASVRIITGCIAGPEGESQYPYLGETATTDSSGNFVFLNKVPAIGISLGVQKENYIDVWPFRQPAGNPIQTYILGPNTGPITLRIAPGAFIFGTVRGQEGAPLPDAWVSLYFYETYAGRRRLEGQTIRTDPDGSYRFGPYRPGRYYLVAQPWLGLGKPPQADKNGNMINYVPLRYPKEEADRNDRFFQLGEGQQEKIDFDLHRQVVHRISGATSEGWHGNTPLLQVFDASLSTAYFVKWPLPCCDFETWLPKGSFELRSDQGDFEGAISITVDDQDIAGLVIPLGPPEMPKIEIEVRSAANPDHGDCVSLDMDAACRGWNVYFLRLRPDGYIEPGPGSQPFGLGHHATISAKPGSYNVLFMTFGNFYTLSMFSGTVDLIHEPLIVKRGEPPKPIRVVLAEAAEISGITRRGKDPAPAWIYAIPKRPDTRRFDPSMSQPDGTFNIQGLPPGSYFVFATDFKLNLDLRNSEEVEYWERRAALVNVHAGQNPSFYYPSFQ